jgi:hypothetical protein
MIPSPYFIEFHGGRFDGLRQPSDFVLDSTRLEMTRPALPFVDGVSARRVSYEYRRSTLTFVEQSPVVTFHMHYVGAVVTASTLKRAHDWIESIWAILRRTVLRPQLPFQAHNGGIRIRGGRKNVVLHGHS